ncbi:MAG TPA: S41 family peptidase [Candidatus Dormibacteraeota bacterium]|nr:S41 family peptidase [Candidatus Dormibacteraeota bacterium]
MRRGFSLAGILLVGLVLGAAGGIYADQAYPDQLPLIAQPGTPTSLDQATFQRALRVIQNDYYNPRLDYSALSQGTVRGLVEGLNDRFSYYLNPAEYKRQLEGYSGQYIGIGVEVNSTGVYPVIDSVFPDSPASKAGIQAGDVVVKVDGKDLHGLSSDQASNLIRGQAGTAVVITVDRNGVQQDLKVVREPIAIPSVRSTTLEGAVLYIRIYSFGDSTASDFDKALKSGLPGAKGVIVDLRDDGGGFIDAAQNVVSQFVGSGEVFELRDHAGHIDRRNVLGSPPDPTLPLVVLVNANSASASEIVAGSLEKHGRAKLVGTVTFGKGSVQQDFPLPDGSDLHLTIRHWFLPDGSSVELKGLTPDDAVTLASPTDIYDVSKPDQGHANDAQLNAALGLLSADSP